MGRNLLGESGGRTSNRGHVVCGSVHWFRRHSKSCGRARQSPPPNSPEGAKTGLRQRVAKARGKLEKYFLEKGHEWGSGFESLQDWEQSDAIILNQFNAYIWKQMFPSIPYDDDRFDQIRLMAVDAVTSAVSDFNGQWAKFKRNAVWFGAKERKKQNIVFRPVLKVSFAGKPLWNAAEVHGQSGPQYH